MNNFDKLYAIPVPPNSVKMVEEISKNMEEKLAREEEYKERNLIAVEETAKNTKEVIDRLNNIVDNQNKYIKILETQLATQEEECNNIRGQLDFITNIFFSTNSIKEYESKLLDLFENEVNKKNSLSYFFKNIAENASGDFFAEKMLVLYNVIKQFFM